MKAAEWIDRLKAARGWDSDYRVAKELELSRSAVSLYRSRPATTLDDETAAKVAAALDLEPHIIVLDQVAERTKSPAVRSSLERVLERIGGGGRLDITSAASTAPGGAPERAGAPGARTDYALSPLAQLARAVQSMVSYSPALSLA